MIDLRPLRLPLQSPHFEQFDLNPFSIAAGQEMNFVSFSLAAMNERNPNFAARLSPYALWTLAIKNGANSCFLAHW